MRRDPKALSEDDYTEVHVTYDLWDEQRRVRAPEARRFLVSGAVRAWKVGRFETERGRSVHAVRVIHGSPKESEFIEVPEEAVNVQLHLGPLPRQYRHLKRPA